MANQILERKGPHKSMHCKFCKGPGFGVSERQSQSHLEKKTKIRLVSQAADLQVYDVTSEPGLLPVESEACICQLEGEELCVKCAPDPNRPPLKKKKCTCPRGAKLDLSKFDPSSMNKKKVRRKKSDDEFWWEKYEREQAAIEAETWDAWMAQLAEDKKLGDARFKESCLYICKLAKPKWFHILSCPQVLNLEFLSTAIRLDLDENITDRTYFVLSGIGFYPRPKRKILKKCLKFCSYNAIDFLNQLQLLLKEEDPFDEKIKRKNFPKCYQNLYSWNDRLIMTSICYLEFPQILREIMDRLPPLPRPSILPPLPYPEISKKRKKTYETPYDEPVWRDRLNWVEKMKIDRINRCRLHMENKRVKIPYLALVRRPSLIDARPPFLSQIEANERASRSRRFPDKSKTPDKKSIETFNSKVDLTAIAGVEVSEISTTDKADTDEICMFLRGQSKTDSTGGETETKGESRDGERKTSTASERERTVPSTMPKTSKSVSREGEFVPAEAEEPGEDLPFRTPPKTESGTTIMNLCPAPVSSTIPPPAPHYEEAKRQLDIINEEICCFNPTINPFVQLNPERFDDDEKFNVTERLIKAAKKLRKYSVEQELPPEDPPPKKLSSTIKKKKIKKQKKEKSEFDLSKSECDEEKCSLGGEQPETTEGEETKGEYEGIVCYGEESIPSPEPSQKSKRSKKKRKKRKPQEKKEKKSIIITLQEEIGEYIKSKPIIKKKDNFSMTESWPGQYDSIYKDPNEEEERGGGEEQAKIYTGKVNPLLKQIMKDLADEGYISAGYEQITFHPDIQQLIKHLQGEFLDRETKEWLWLMSKKHWKVLGGNDFYAVAPPELGLSVREFYKATWAQKSKLQKVAKAKKDLFYFNVAKMRAQSARDFYPTLHQKYLGVTSGFLNMYYSYNVSKFEDSIVQGLGV